MAPDEPASPKRLDAQFNQIVHGSYGTDAPQWPAAAPYPPKKPRKTGRILAIVTSIMAVVCLIGLAMAASVLDREGVLDREEQVEPPSESEIVAGRIHAALDKQRFALLAGDEAGYLGILDGSIDAADKAALSRQFRSLRAMKVASWTDRVMTATALPNSDLWDVDLISSACFVVVPCPEGQATANTKWRVNDGLARLADWDAGRHPHPWQASDLVARVGERIIAATTKEHESKLATVLKEAEQAAKVADRFARDKPPARYIVYYAGKTEWKTWFLTKPPDWSAGVAVDVSDDRYEVVLNAEEMDDLMPMYLRHELAHASSMPGRIASDEKYWYLMEGIAELAALDGAPAREHLGISSAPAALAAAGGKGFRLEAPGADATAEVVDGSYAVAFLAARCMSERFGEKKFVEFFHVVLHDNKPEEKASSQVFGMEWSVLSGDCLDYVRNAIK